MDSSDTDTETNVTSKNRLGKCEVCDHELAIYCCPKCEVKTCGLGCLKIHKKELNCTGIRDKTKFVALREMTETDFMSDYCFLEECTRYVADRKHDKIKSYTSFNKRLPAEQFKFRQAALERDIKLKFLLSNFTRNACNSSYFDRSEKIIYWRVEWLFPNAENLRTEDEKCAETVKLIDLAGKYLHPSSPSTLTSDANRKQLAYYQSRGIGNLTFLLKAEGVKKCKNRFFELDADKTLRENFKGKTLVEYPAIYVVFSDVVNNLFDVIDDGKEHDVTTVGKGHDNLKLNLLLKIKDDVPILKQSNVIYLIERSCGKVYIGQTLRLLKNG